LSFASAFNCEYADGVGYRGITALALLTMAVIDDEGAIITKSASDLHLRMGKRVQPLHFKVETAIAGVSRAS